MNTSVQAHYIFKVFPVKIQNTGFHMMYDQREYNYQFNFSLVYVHPHKMPSKYYCAVNARTIDQILTTTSMGAVREGTNKHLLPQPPIFRKN
jgi:hypothetical protein